MGMDDGLEYVIKTFGREFSMYSRLWLDRICSMPEFFSVKCEDVVHDENACLDSTLRHLALSPSRRWLRDCIEAYRLGASELREGREVKFLGTGMKLRRGTSDGWRSELTEHHKKLLECELHHSKTS